MMAVTVIVGGDHSKEVVEIELLAVFVGIMTVTIMAVGYLFNAIM